MPSASLRRWRTIRRSALDEIVLAHESLGDTAPGRRYATRQLNHAYAVLLAAQFQGFCRDLHSEGVKSLAKGVTSDALSMTFRDILVRNRRLDRGNASYDGIKWDFDSLGLDFWRVVIGLDARNQTRLARLKELNDWRNAIAHQDFSRFAGGAGLRFRRVAAWRSACDRLAVSFDEVIREHVQSVTGIAPW